VVADPGGHLKYVVILLRADNNGEGGTLTLVALAQRAMGRRAPVALLLGAAGAGLFYGDAVITPAISVLSAMEGLKIATPAFEPYIVPVALVILVRPLHGPEPGDEPRGRLLRPHHGGLVSWS
jgi:KUP system potassium uptake protein